MRVLLVNVNAVSGSTGKIVTDIKTVLEQQGHECMIAYGANQTVEHKDYARICTETERKTNALLARITGVRYGLFLSNPAERLKHLIEAWEPDIVNLHCANGYIADLFEVLGYLAERQIKTVVTNHSEFYYTGGCGHAGNCDKWMHGCRGVCPKNIHNIFGVSTAHYTWKRFHQTFEKFRINDLFITSVSPWLESRAKKSPSLERFHSSAIMNGVDSTVFRPALTTDSLKSPLPVDKPVILHVSAEFTTEHTNKGGDYICKLARLMPDVSIAVASSYTGKIENLPENVYLLGRTASQEELAILYSAASVTIITSFRETFSMVTAESLCCGTPVVGFKAGGPESIAIPDFTEFVEYGDIEELHRKTRMMLHSIYDADTISKKAHSIYSKEVMADRYLECYNRLISMQ